MQCIACPKVCCKADAFPSAIAVELCILFPD